MSDSAPSIGSIGSIAFDGRNDRSKGLLTEVVESPSRLHGLLAGVMREHVHGTRINVRLLLGHDVEPGVRGINWHGFPLSLEVHAPVVGHPTVGALAYYGANSVRRLPSDETRHEERALLMRVIERPIGLLPDVPVDLLTADRVTPGEVAELVDIYRTSYTGYLTEFNEPSVRAMIADNTVLVVRDERGHIASVCVAESVTLDLPGGPLRLVEISDAATRRDCRDRGYYSAAKHHCIAHLRSQPGPTVITTEARANSGRVLRSNIRLGLAYAGYEPQHCVISSSNDEDVAQDTKYGDLVVFYVP